MSLNACSDPEEIHIPMLEFDRYDLIKEVNSNRDSLLILHIKYSDEDGDIGLGPADTFPPYHEGMNRYNLWVDIFDEDNGGLDTITIGSTSIPQNFHQRIPDLRPTGKSKYIEGSIEVSYDAGSLTLYPDKIRVFMTLLDRKLHQSQKIDVGSIYLTH